MFRLNQSNTFHWPVTVSLPESGGKYIKETFDAEFRRVSQTRLKELSDALQTGADVVPFVREIMAGWKGITDGDSVVPFSQSSLEQLLDITGVSQAIVTAYGEAVSGISRKN